MLKLQPTTDWHVNELVTAMIDSFEATSAMIQHTVHVWTPIHLLLLPPCPLIAAETQTPQKRLYFYMKSYTTACGGGDGLSKK
jgi:hypothetical protein